MAKHILFIMIDQLRWDYLSCYGHASLQTPHIDAIAARGVRFNKAYTQGTSCGNSRASFYTGRHVRSHGATWNDIPFELNELTLADYMQQAGIKTALMGKTHMRSDANGLARLNIDPQSELGLHLANTGFEHGERDDGLHPDGPGGKYSAVEPRYNQYLRENGFDGDNPWLDWANSGQGENREVCNGFLMQNAHLPSRLPAEFSETAYMTDRAIEFIDQAGEQPWCLHLSYIKPHWPLIAPAPYHQTYTAADVQAGVRDASELRNPHPVYRGFTNMRHSKFWEDPSRAQHVIPTYMGLIRQLDDEIGRLIGHLRGAGLLDSTLIALTADHGDYLGDHWLGEKDLFHDCSAKLPLILLDPSPAADATRGTINNALVGAIDLLPTFIDYVGGPAQPHRLEGQSLMGWLHGAKPANWRECVFSECDYARLSVRSELGRDVSQCRLTMAFDGRYKLVHCLGYGPMLYDLAEDPQELRDVAREPGYADAVATMKDRLLDWSATLRNRTALSDEQFDGKVGKSATQGIWIGFWQEQEVPEAWRRDTHRNSA